MLSLQQVACLYRVRLNWCSNSGKARCTAGVRVERILVELYAKLIGLLVFQFLTMPVCAQAVNLSPFRTFNRFMTLSGRVANTVSDRAHLQQLIAQFHAVVVKVARRENRATRLSTYQHLLAERAEEP